MNIKSFIAGVVAAVASVALLGTQAIAADSAVVYEAGMTGVT